MSLHDHPHRPRYHFTPARNWINDPNGLVWFAGEYHLFYQYNPFGETWGHMSWGHAVSPDLVSWRELGVAIAEDEREMIFSGSAVCDHANTSGLGEVGAPALVAIYSGHSHAQPQRQTQNLAFSRDLGRTWTKFAGNPVLDLGLEHFRDPKVFWHEASAGWVMIVALSDQQKVALFASPDLKAWRLLSEFGPAGAPGALWECPDLFRLPIEGEPGREKWVLKVDMFEGGVAGGAGAQYFIGEFDGLHFIPDADESGGPLWRWADFGKDFYAAVTWSNLPATQDRPVWIGWMSNHVYARDLPTRPWKGAMTAPRRVSLERRSAGLILTQQPVPELEALRGEAVTVGDVALTSDPVDLARFDGREAGLDLTATLTPATSGQTRLILTWTSGDCLSLGYDAAAGAVFVDRSASGLMSDDPRFTGRRLAPWPLSAGQSLDVRVLLDRASIELFVDGGAVVFTEQIFPRGELQALSAVATGAGAALAGARLWPMGAADLTAAALDARSGSARS